MRRVAICTYWYPPARTIASLRLAKFVKYLPEFGWEPFVFTVAPGSDRYLRAGALPDAAAPGHVHRFPDPSVHVVVDRLAAVAGRRHQAGNAAPGDGPAATRGLAYRVYRDAICFPDEAWPWLLAYRRIRRAVVAVKPDVIFSSSPPATAHLIASRLAADLGTPWTADFRDPWSQSHTIPKWAPLRAIEQRLERRTIARATAITTVSQPIAEQLAALHGKAAHVILNGFDVDDIPESGPERDDRERLVLVYTGMLYDGKRTPALVFEALDRLLRAGAVRAGEIVVRFYGRNLHVAGQLMGQFPAIAGAVELCGEVSYEAALVAQRGADALLLLEWTDPQARGVVTGKLFEYLAANREILAVGPRGGEIDRILTETRRGKLASTADEATELLTDALQRFRAGRLGAEGSSSGIAEYTRRNQTRRLAEVFDRISDRYERVQSSR